MRTEVELLELLLKETPERLETGLCLVLKGLNSTGVISDAEFYELKFLIKKHRPNTLELYYFPSGELPPRIKYLKRLIRIYKKLENQSK